MSSVEREEQQWLKDVFRSRFWKTDYGAVEQYAPDGFLFVLCPLVGKSWYYKVYDQNGNVSLKHHHEIYPVPMNRFSKHRLGSLRTMEVLPDSPEQLHALRMWDQACCNVSHRIPNALRLDTEKVLYDHEELEVHKLIHGYPRFLERLKNIGTWHFRYDMPAAGNFDSVTRKNFARCMEVHYNVPLTFDFPNPDEMEEADYGVLMHNHRRLICFYVLQAPPYDRLGLFVEDTGLGKKIPLIRVPLIAGMFVLIDVGNIEDSRTVSIHQRQVGEEDDAIEPGDAQVLIFRAGTKLDSHESVLAMPPPALPIPAPSFYLDDE